MDDTTLIITARSRPDYLRHTLASWAAVPESVTLRRVIVKLGHSERWDEMADVIESSALAPGIDPDSEAAKRVPGEHYSLGEAISDVFAEDQDCEFIIHGSEDVVVSDDVLRYFAWARQEMRGDIVCAHNELGQGWHDIWDDSDADQEIVRLSGGFSPWAWGFSRATWKDMLRREWDWDCTSGRTTCSAGGTGRFTAS
jgi:hypothetical protein